MCERRRARPDEPEAYPIRRLSVMDYRLNETFVVDQVFFVGSSVTSYSPMVIHATTGKLQDIALVSLTASLIQYKNTLQIQTRRDELFALPEVDLIKVKLPTSLKARVTSIAKVMKSSISKWQEYHDKFVFFDRELGDYCIYVFDLFDELVWMPNGSINPKLTAKKILNSCKLSNVEKYRFACVYCFEEDEKSLRPMFNEIEKELDIHPFLNYWFLSKNSHPDADERYLLKRFKDSTHDYNFSAFEYLWSKIRLANRISVASKSWKFNCSYVWHLLCDLNDSEFDATMSRKFINFFETFAGQSGFEKHMVLIWNRIADRIDIYTFEDIFTLINHCHEYNIDIESRNDLQWELWRNAPHYLKNMAVSRNLDNYLSPPYNFPLIVDVLSRIDFQDRVEYWRNNWYRFFMEPYCKIGNFREIMELCFENVESISTFKNEDMINDDVIGITCRELLLEKKHVGVYLTVISPFKQVQKYLNACSSDPAIISKLKHQIISAISTEELLNCIFDSIDPQIIEDLDDFLVDAFASSEKLQKFKTEFVTSHRSLELINYQLCHRLDRLPHVMKLVDVFSNFKEEIAKMKRNLVEFTRSMITENMEEDARKMIKSVENVDLKKIWKDFITWCFDENEAEIKKFKESLPIDDFSKLALAKVLKTFSWKDMSACRDHTKLSHAQINDLCGVYLKNFAEFDSILDWFFDSKEDIRKFKLKVTNSCDFDYMHVVFGMPPSKRKFKKFQKVVAYILELWCKI